MHSLAPYRSRWVAASVSLLALLSAPLGREAPALEVGQKAPQFSARALDDSRSLSLGEYRGKVVYLDFWASWCRPCAKSLPVMEQLRQEFEGTDLEILAINVDRDPAKARSFIEGKGVGFPSASDPKGHLPKIYEIPTMPTSFLIDRNGVIRHVHPGFREKDVEGLRTQIRALVEEGK